MIQIFEQLETAELALLKEAVPMIAILIAGADGNIDEKERAWAEKITKIRTFSVPEEYQTFYEEIGSDFQEKLDAMIKVLPTDTEERNSILNERLKDVNAVLAKLDPKYGSRLYREFKRFAKHVATASGGFLGFFSISAAEAKWVNLPMLDEIVYVGEEGEEEE